MLSSHEVVLAGARHGNRLLDVEQTILSHWCVILCSWYFG